MDHAFEDVEVKINAPELLEAALRRKKRRCMIGTGAMSDPYWPGEVELGLVRRCLKIIEKYGFGLALQTKSPLVLRDLEALTAIHEKAKCVVQVTLTTFDEPLCRLLEPNVATTKERFAALCALRERNIPTVVWLSPILPYLNDTPENIRGILAYCREAEVKGVLCFGMGLTLREGNREYFYAQLDRHFPGLSARYSRRFGTSYGCMSEREGELNRFFEAECARLGLWHDTDAIFRWMQTLEEREEQVRFW
ncbi:MAG: radical SAM protein [Clostridia bacterium]|nr:radical SAM protein [Clostridia bacterium]